jgi:hypothetical protein
MSDKSRTRTCTEQIEVQHHLHIEPNILAASQQTTGLMCFRMSDEVERPMSLFERLFRFSSGSC